MFLKMELSAQLHMERKKKDDKPHLINMYFFSQSQSVCLLLWEAAESYTSWRCLAGLCEWQFNREETPSIFFLHLAASIAGVSNNPQDEEEDVQDVKVEMEDCKDVIIWTQWQLLVAQEHLSVDSQPLERKRVNSSGSSWEKCEYHFVSCCFTETH